MNKNQILELKLEIDKIKEYVQSELCRKCDEMQAKLKEYEEAISAILTNPPEA